MKSLKLDRPLTIRPGEDYSNHKITPSPLWDEPPGTPLIKFTTTGWFPEYHPGAYPSFVVSNLQVDCLYTSAGIYFDRIIGSSFFGLSVIKARGTSLQFRRCKESNFHGVNLWGGMKIADEPVINLAYDDPNHEGKLDGNNHLHMFGLRCDYFNHNTYILVGTSNPNDSKARVISINGGQFHVPSKHQPFKGMPFPEFNIPDPTRIMVRPIGRLGPVYFNNCHFQTGHPDGYGGKPFKYHRSFVLTNCTGTNL